MNPVTATTATINAAASVRIIGGSQCRNANLGTISAIKNEISNLEIAKGRRMSMKNRLEYTFTRNLKTVFQSSQLAEISGGTRWHQRKSELVIDHGYTIHTGSTLESLAKQEYVMMDSGRQRVEVLQRLVPSDACKIQIDSRSTVCEWKLDGTWCGETDRLQYDHINPHSLSTPDPQDVNRPEAWQRLCERHNLKKRNYFANGRLQMLPAIRDASKSEKRAVYDFLHEFFNSPTMTPVASPEPTAAAGANAAASELVLDDDAD